MRPAIEEELEGLKLYICCKDEFQSLIGRPGIVFESEFQRTNFGYLRELVFDNTCHPVMKLIEESNLKLPSLKRIPPTVRTNKCVLVTNYLPPVASLTPLQIEHLKQKIISQGFEVSVNGSIADAGWVVGVESLKLYEAAFQGIKTSLVPTGLGTKLFQLLLPEHEILNV